ncbi:MAG: sugar ABC transporter substrate-binding protein [Ignavibacterium sp.]|jgi:ABC-type glycerol-3-phosphate transport system substrate-binding protein|nr:MAG: sugar ABC transporter substrate-binding protein [Ignavibacterium sp.]
MMKINLIIFFFLFAVIALIYFFTQEKSEQKTQALRFVSLAWQERSIATNLSIVKEWNNQHPEKQVEYIQGTWNSAHDYLITAFETGDVPDIFHYESSVIIDYAMRGYLTDLAPYITIGMKDDILDVAWATVTRPNGEVSGIPFLIESLVVLYNKSLFEKAGITPPSIENPWSWDDLRKAAITLTKDTNGDNIIDQYGAGIGLRNSANIIMNTSISFGGSFFRKENDHFVVKVKDEEKKLLQTIVDMIYKDKSISPASVGESGAGMIPGFFSGKYAMLVGIGSWARQQLVENAPKDFAWGVMPPLKAKTQMYGVSTQTLSIPKKSKRTKEAMMFIDFMLDSKNTARLALDDWMIPARKSCLDMQEFKDTLGNWDITCSAVNTLGVGSWLGAPGYVEWKSRVANPVLQELFAGRISVKEAAERIEHESNIVLSRYKKRGEVW